MKERGMRAKGASPTSGEVSAGGGEPGPAKVADIQFGEGVEAGMEKSGELTLSKPEGGAKS
jgi:hypothetical protein